MSIDIAKSNNEKDKLRQLDRALGFIQFRLEFLRIRTLLWNPTGLERTMKNISNQIDEEQLVINNLEKAMEIAVNQYKCSEIMMTDYLNSHAGGKNITYDDRGRYGGDQGRPAKIGKTEEQYDKIVEIIRNYYPDYTDKDIEKYLKKLNSEGCGYVALINTIFNQYAGRADEFEKAFGFPMYDENGELNFDLLLVDFYSAMDNHNSFLGIDYYDRNEDASAVKGFGTTMESREYRWEKYLHDRGIQTDVHDITVTPDNYNQVAQDGEIIISMSPVVLYDENGKCVFKADAGHAMTITGVTEDGMYKVTSWGKEYYIKPDGQYDRMNFQQVSY